MGSVEYCPSDLSSLRYDTACLQVHNDLEVPIDLFSVTSECVKCNSSFWTNVPLQASVSLVIPAVHSISLSATRQSDDIPLCEETLSFTQHQLVFWDIKNCTFKVLEKGDDVYMPLYMFALFVASLLLLITIFRSLYHSQWLKNLFNCNPVNIDLQNDLGNPSSSTDSLLVQSELVPLRRLSSRILALDTFRGLTIALMILVNYGGGKFWFFEHAAWNGLTIADLVFPWFAWVMGMSLVISYRSKLRTSVSRCAVMYVSCRRALFLIALGLLLNMYNNNDLSTARFCGVLQRLGMAHLIVSTLEILFMNKHPSYQYRRWQVSEVVECWRQWLVIILLVALQVCVTLYMHVPGCPTGYLGPGGAGDHSAAPLCTGGAARHIDSFVFTNKHLYQKSRVSKVYNTTVPFDPEGILGTLTTCLTVYLGVQAGYIMLSYTTTRERCVRWILWSILTGVSAGVLCDWAQEGGVIPVNKQLWSLSFALLTASAAFLLFTLLFLVVDHFHLWGGEPFRSAGMNAVMLYVGHIVTRNTFPWSWKPHDLTSHFELLNMNVIAVALWLIIARDLRRREIFLTI